MGCVLASEQSAFDSIAHTGELQAMLEELERLTLRYDDVRKLYEVFSFFLAADGHDSTISLTTLLLRMGIPYTAFTHEVFTIFSPGKLDFRALALSVWNYCTLTIENMHLFVFDLYNTHCRPLTPTEVSNIFKDMYGDVEWKENRHTHNATVELRRLEVCGATFTLDSFNAFMFKRMILLVPAMQLQRALQKRFCGRSFWKEQAKRRKKLYPEHNYVSIAHLLNPDLIGLSSSADTLAKPIASPTTNSRKKKMSLKVHPDNSDGADTADVSSPTPQPLSSRSSIRRKHSSRLSLKFFNERQSKLNGLSAGELSIGAHAESAGAGCEGGGSADVDLMNAVEDTTTTTTDARTHRKTIRPTSAAQGPSRLRSRQRHTQLNETMN